MSLLAWYPLNGDLNDYSGNKYSLKMYGGSDVIISNSGKIGKCYEIPTKGSTTRLSSPSNQYFKDNCSMFCWLNVSVLGDSGSANGVVTNHSHSSESGMGITLKARSASTFSVSCNTGYVEGGRTFNSYYGNSVLNLNTWYHVGFTYNSNTKKISFYVNGILDGESIIPSDKTMKYKSDAISIFAWSLSYLDSSYYRPAQKINDVRIYDHVLSAKEIKEIASAKIIHYKFNDPIEEPTVNMCNTFRFTTTTKGNDYFIKTSSDVWYAGAILTNTTVSPGKTYTWSFDIKSDTKFSVTFDPNCIATNYTGNDLAMETSKSMSSNYTTPGKWQRVYLTVTVKADAQSPYLCHSFCPSTSSELKVYVRNSMLEEKDHNTPFTNNSRNFEVSDSSGFRNHAVIDPITSPSWTNNSCSGLGSFKFKGDVKMSNGSYQHIKSKYPIRIPEEGTMSFYIKHEGLENSDNKYAVGFSNFCSMNNNNIIGLIYYYEASNYTTKSVNKQLRDGNWHMYTISWSNITKIIKFYADGVLLGSAVPTDMYHTGSERYFLVGNAWGTSYGGHSGYLDDVRVYATQLSDEDIFNLYSVKGSVSKNGKLLSNTLIEKENLFDENIILDRQTTLAINNNSKLMKLDDRYTIALSASSYYSNTTSHSIFPDNYFKPNTSYVFNITINGNLIYNGNEVPCGLRIRFSDNSNNDTFVVKTSGTWKNFKYISPENKTISKVEVYYYIGNLFYIDLSKTFICENTPNNIDKNGVFRGNSIDEINNNNLFRIYKTGLLESTEFIEN